MPRQVVEAPPLAAPTVGLLRSAVVVEDGDGARWLQDGVSFESRSCGPSGVSDPCDNTKTVPPDEGTEQVDGDAFVVWAADRCSVMDNGRDGEARARNRLAAWQGFQIERELWEGAFHRASNKTGRWLADAVADGTDVISATAVATRDALGALEEYLAGCVSQGMIHAHPNLVTSWDSLNLIRREGARLYTVQDTMIVPGRGYTGAAPSTDGAADPIVDASGETAYAYATSMIQVRLGPTRAFTDVDRAVNTRTWRAERSAVFTWDACCHGAINVDLADRS